MTLGAKIVLILLLLGVSINQSCRKFETFPIEPVITFKEFLVEINPQTNISERGILKFTYTDGDGDLGLDPHDTLPPFHRSGSYYYNMIIKYYEKQHGKFVEIPLLSWNPDSLYYDTITFNARIPNLTPESGNMAIRGEVQDTLFIYNPLSDFDTIKFSVFIYDRALHKSNEIETDPIIRYQ